jgi:hypothetical protein
MFSIRLSKRIRGGLWPSLRVVRLISGSPNRISPRSKPDGTAWPHLIGSSDLITSKRSVFLAHASALPSSTSLASFISYLRTHDPHASRLKRATHRMTAWRLSSSDSSQRVQGGEDDGGERGAGDWLARLVDSIPLNRRKDGVALVVWRWYGGTPLGGERWRCISSVAKEALRDVGFIGGDSEEKSSGVRGSKKDRRKR